MEQRDIITKALAAIFASIEQLREAFPGKEFTIDGRLVGDIGEVIAALEYDIKLYEIQQADHDGETLDGKRVQVKATFKDSLTFKTVPDYYLGFKLSENGGYEEVFNGPGRVIFERYKRRKGIGEALLSFPNRELKNLSNDVPQIERIRRKSA
jgi:hypothetical protein